MLTNNEGNTMKNSLYINKNNARITVREADNVRSGEEEFSLDSFGTKDLLKLKYKLNEEVENRMDLDEVLDDSTDKLMVSLSKATSLSVAKLLRFIGDRIDQIDADAKRNKKLEKIILDELGHRMLKEGTNEMKFDGIVTVGYKNKTVYSTTDEGWEKVYTGIASNAIEAQMDTAVSRFIAENSMDYPTETLKEVAEQAYETLIRDLKNNPNNLDSFGILQKRFTSTTLKEMLDATGELPEGVTSREIRDLKARKAK